MTTLNVNLTATGTGGTVELNGVDVSPAVAGLTINANVGKPTTAIIRIPATMVTLKADATVDLPAPLAALLVAAGWTPPEEKPVFESGGMIK